MLIGIMDIKRKDMVFSIPEIYLIMIFIVYEKINLFLVEHPIEKRIGLDLEIRFGKFVANWYQFYYQSQDTDTLV